MKESTFVLRQKVGLVTNKFINTLFALFICINSFGQYSNIDGIQKLDSIEIRHDLISFGIPAGNGHYIIKLSSNDTFYLMEHTCFLIRDTIKGTWAISNNMLSLKGYNIQKSYLVFKLSNFYFLIPEIQEPNFLSDIIKARTLFKANKSVKFEDTIITQEELICLYLHKTYPSKIPDAITSK